VTAAPTQTLVKAAVAIALVAFLLVVPFVFGEFGLSLFIVVGIYIILMVGLALFLGYGGQFSFAQAVFYGIGAYTSAILVTRWSVPPALAFVAAGAVGGLVAYGLSAPILRLRGYYLAMATLACCQIFHVLLIENASLTGGPSGIYSIPPFSIAGIEFGTSQFTYALVWIVAIANLVFVSNLMRSRVGRALKALQSSEEETAVLGIDGNALRTKIFVLTGVTGAFAGSLFAHFVAYISPGTFTLDLSIWLVVILTVGGVRTIWGVVLAAAVTTLFPFLLGHYQNYNMLVFGIMLILVLKYMPDGIAGFVETKIGAWLRRRSA
jgi:branched-chain amino acid transport system permease protein